jgi:hypothetical protein
MKGEMGYMGRVAGVERVSFAKVHCTLNRVGTAFMPSGDSSPCTWVYPSQGDESLNTINKPNHYARVAVTR